MRIEVGSGAVDLIKKNLELPLLSLTHVELQATGFSGQ